METIRPDTDLETISCSYKSKVVCCPSVERELHYDIKVDTLSFCIVQNRLLNALDGAASVLILLQCMHLPLEALDPLGLLTTFGSLRAVFESFGSIIVDN